MNKLKKLSVAALALVGFGANAAGPDMSALTGAVDAGTIVAAIAAVAAIKILPPVASWGYNQVIKLFR